MPENILVPKTTDEKLQWQILIEGVTASGLTYVTPLELIAAAHIVLAQHNLEMPFDNVELCEVSKSQRKNINDARRHFVDDVLARIEMHIDGQGVCYVADGIDITDHVKGVAVCWSAYHQTWMNGVDSRLTEFFDAVTIRKPIVYIATDSRRLTQDTVNPNIGILFESSQALRASRTLRLRRKSDVVIVLETSQDFAERLSSVVSDFTDLRMRRAALKDDITTTRIKLEDQFTRDSWPGHPLVAQTKQVVRNVVQDLIEERQVICDPLDLEYQTLFRLTSLPVASVFENGDRLESYLQSHDAYGYWRNILTLDPQRMAYPVKRDVVERIAQEQLSIILNRLQDTTVPVASLTRRNGIFAEEGWRLQKHSGEVMAVKINDGRAIEQKDVTFKPVDVAYARMLHESLHYIHTPRATKAFGLYLENEEIPFSVVAFDGIDRPYKEDLLLMLGYDPSKCLDLARLYSKPGTPFNTSSTIFTLAFAYLREHEPETQAVLSAFMPTYAHGMSMISAGFNYGCLVKEWKHSFIKRQINGQEAWELATKRRIDGSQTTIQSLWPLLPVFELIAPIQAPRFAPFAELDGAMVSRGL